jgi:hypothetical protein
MLSNDQLNSCQKLSGSGGTRESRQEISLDGGALYLNPSHPLDSVEVQDRDRMSLFVTNLSYRIPPHDRVSPRDGRRPGGRQEVGEA